MLPAFFNNMFEIEIQPTHTYNTRHRNVPRLSRPNTLSAERALRYAVPKLVSQTPSHILDKITTHSISGYCHYIKKTMNEKYSDTCSIPNCYICKLN